MWTKREREQRKVENDAVERIGEEKEEKRKKKRDVERV